jgi:hypothetical protein
MQGVMLSATSAQEGVMRDRRATQRSLARRADERQAAGEWRPAPALSPAPVAPAPAAIRPTAAQSRSPIPVQRQLFVAPQKNAPNKDTAIQALTNIARKLGFDLDFREHGDQVEALRISETESEHLSAIRKDSSGAEIVRIFNRVSGKALRKEDAPRLVEPAPNEKKGPSQPPLAPVVTKKAPQSLEDLQNEGLVTKIAATDYSYYWGGTTKIDAALRTQFPGKPVRKTELPSGLRQLTVETLVFTEERNPFPASANKPLGEGEQAALGELAGTYELRSADAVAFLAALLTMNAAKGLPVRANKRLIIAFFEQLHKEWAEVPKGEWSSLDQILAGVHRTGLYREIVRSGEPNEVIVSLLAMPSIGQALGSVEATPELVDDADFFATRTDILSSPAWRSARTDEEYAGLLGEYMSLAP